MPTNICFLCPAIPAPVGGIKVIYQLAELIDRHYAPAYTSEVCSLGNPHFRCRWFENDVKIRGNYLFDPISDFLIVPEYLAGHLGDAIFTAGLPFAIFVQNGYLTCGSHSVETLAPIYRRAAFIISISDDTTRCLRLLFPDVADNIIPYRYYVDERFYYDPAVKANEIAYMPRKLKNHSQFVVSALRSRLPHSWTIRAIDNLPETEVARTLSRSRIFLAFSDQEGLPVPPLEAALSGNIVIGYHGEGGREYWTPPLFVEAEKGNLISFISRTLETVNKLADKVVAPDATKIRELHDRYSKSRQAVYLTSIIDSVSQWKKLNGEKRSPAPLVDLTRHLKTSLLARLREAVIAKARSRLARVHK